MSKIRERSRPRRGPGRPPGEAEGEGGRDALLRAARELLAERGLTRVTVRDVAERAGVKPALVNYYFGGKDGLLRAVVATVASEARDRLDRVLESAGSAQQRVRDLFAGWADVLAAEPYVARLLVEQVLFADDEVLDTFAEQFARPNARAVERLVLDGCASGELRDVDPRFLVPSLVGISFFFHLGAPMLLRVFGLRETAPELAHRHAAFAADLVLHGIAAGGRAPGASAPQREPDGPTP